MASVTTTPSSARGLLDYVLGKKMVRFGELSSEEGEELLRDVLREVDLRELRGFRPLKEFLTFSPGSFTTGPQPHTLDIEVLQLSDSVELTTSDFSSDAAVAMDTHLLSICRGWVRGQAIYRRHESDLETSDWHEAHSWGRSAYRHRGEGEILSLRRPRNHTGADDNLLVVRFWYEKVPQKQEYLISKIEAMPLPIGAFMEYFGEIHSRIAVEMIWELRTAYARTVSELESRATYFRREAGKFERFSEALSYD